MSVGKIKFVVGAASLRQQLGASVVCSCLIRPTNAPAAYGGDCGDIRVQTDVLIGLLLLSPRASVNNSLRGQAQQKKKKKKKKS
jgi:hypothetical protein